MDASSRSQLQGATVTVMDPDNTSNIIHVLSDAHGFFLVPNLQPRNYTVITSYTGYTSDTLRITIDKNSQLNYEVNILLSPQTSMLNTIKVISQKPLIRIERDKIIFDISQSSLSKGNSLWDILSKSPGVETEGNSISILGTSGASVLINGRPTLLSGEQLVNYLKGLTGDQVSHIEIIQHPGSKYDMGQGIGVINFVLKKNQSLGFNSSLTLSYGRGKYDKFVPSLNLNYRSSKLNVYGNYALNVNKDYLTQPSYVHYLDQPVPVHFSQDQRFVTTSMNNNFTIGTDYQINTKSSLGFLFNGSILQKNSDYSNVTSIRSSDRIDSIIKTSSRIHYPNKLLLFNLYYNIHLDSASTLTINMDYGHYTNRNSQDYQYKYYNPDLSQLRADENFSNRVPGKISIKAMSADYTRKLTGSITFETGIKSSETNVNNITQYTQNSTGTGISLINGSFDYVEKINAGYVTIDKMWSKNYLKIGLRVEKTSTHGSTTAQTDDQFNRNYVRPFPTILYTYDFNEKHSLNLSYSTSFERPNYTYLSPFAIQRDPNSYSSGNPFLRPSYTNSFELDYILSKKYTVAFEYDNIYDRIEQLVQQDYSNKVIANVISNIQHCYYYRLYFLFPVSIATWWQSNNVLNNYIIQYKTSYLNGKYDVAKPVFYLSSINTFTLNPSTHIELTEYFRTPSLNGLYHVGTREFVDLGISKAFSNNKASVSLTLTDVFHSNNWKWKIDYLNQNSGYTSYTDSRVLRVNFSYKFGKVNIKAPKKRNSGINEEKDRIR